jgi:hypothetical protein
VAKDDRRILMLEANQWIRFQINKEAINQKSPCRNETLNSRVVLNARKLNQGNN